MVECVSDLASLHPIRTIELKFTQKDIVIPSQETPPIFPGPGVQELHTSKGLQSRGNSFASAIGT